IFENWEGAEKPAAQKVELLEKATQRDPNFALAYCELAKAQIELGDLSPELESEKHFELAKKAADTALRLRPDLPEPHLALARYYWYTAYRVAPAEQVITREAASSKSEHPRLQRRRAEVKLAQGDPVAAQALLEQIPLDFNPVPYIWGTRFKAALYLRDYDAAGRVIAMTPPKGLSELAVFDGPPEWAYAQVARARG